MLLPQADAARPPDWLRLAQASLALYSALADELREQSGIDIALRESVRGALHFTAARQVDNRKLCEALAVAAARGREDSRGANGDAGHV